MPHGAAVGLLPGVAAHRADVRNGNTEVRHHVDRARKAGDLSSAQRDTVDAPVRVPDPSERGAGGSGGFSGGGSGVRGEAVVADFVRLELGEAGEHGGDGRVHGVRQSVALHVHVPHAALALQRIERASEFVSAGLEHAQRVRVSERRAQVARQSVVVHVDVAMARPELADGTGEQVAAEVEVSVAQRLAAAPRALGHGAH